MDHTLTIEIIALLVGVAVIVIETVIIFMLRSHIRVLNDHLEKNENLMMEFKKSINDHLDHLDEHSHKLEERMESLFEKICH